MEDLLVSFSGGQTSAFMLRKILEQRREGVYVVFANTGLEHPKTIEFIKKTQEELGIKIICLEAVVRRGRKSTYYKEVSIDSLSMNGEPFEEVITKYGIPNRSYIHCTRELKTSVIHNWAKEKLSKNYETAIGIRADEMDRINSKYKQLRYKYPLMGMNIRKSDVEEFFNNHHYKLEIENYLGNCVSCWKKSDKKLAMVYKIMPEAFEFFKRMEEKYSYIRTAEDYEYRKFFRLKRSTLDMIEEFKKKDNLSDEEGACGSDSCEAF